MVKTSLADLFFHSDVDSFVGAETQEVASHGVERPTVCKAFFMFMLNIGWNILL